MNALSPLVYVAQSWGDTAFLSYPFFDWYLFCHSSTEVQCDSSILIDTASNIYQMFHVPTLCYYIPEHLSIDTVKSFILKSINAIGLCVYLLGSLSFSIICCNRSNYYVYNGMPFPTTHLLFMQDVF